MGRKSADLELMQRLLDAAAPERKTELAALLGELKPNLFICDDEVSVSLRALGADIEFSHKTMRLFWLLAFTAWKIFRAYSPAALWATASGQRLSELMRQDAGLAAAEGDFKILLLAAQALEGLPSAGDFEWPQGLPEPQPDKSGLANIEDQAASDLCMIAGAYAFLHELRHVWHFRHPPRPSDSTAEEMDCDVFARGFLMDKAGLYAAQSGEPFDKVANRRAMGIALGAWIIYEITPAFGRGGSYTHPPVADRLDALIGNMPVQPNADFWVWTSALLVAAARHRGQSQDLVFNNAEALALHLMEALRAMA